MSFCTSSNSSWNRTQRLF